MFPRKKKNRTGTISVVVVDKSRGGFKEIKSFGVLTSAMHHPKTLIGQALLHQTIVNYKKIFPNKIIKVSLFDITI